MHKTETTANLNKELYVQLKLQNILFKIVSNNKYQHIGQFVKDFMKENQDLEQLLPLYSLMKEQLEPNVIQNISLDVSNLKKDIEMEQTNNILDSTKQAYINTIVRLTNCTKEQALNSLEANNWELAEATFKIYDASATSHSAISKESEPDFVIEI